MALPLPRSEWRVRQNFALDATPGVNGKAKLETPVNPVAGTLRCVQLCGAGFKDHHAPFKFVTAEEFEKWLEEQPTVAERAAKPASELPGK